MSEAAAASTTQPEKKGTSWEDLLPTVLKPRAGWGNGVEIQFFLRMITIEEERLFYKRFAEIADKPNELELEYQILVDGLAAWSTQMPVIITVDEQGGKTVTPVAEVGSASEVIREKFATRSAGNERLAHQLMNRYRNRLPPDVAF